MSSALPEEDDDTDPRCWRKNGWIARIIKNEDDDGWAVEMTRIGDQEPSLTGPWTMGRDKKNPKPLDQYAFLQLVKTANEVLRRHEEAAKARLRRTISFADDDDLRLSVELVIAPDDDDPHAILSVSEERTGTAVRSGRVAADFKLSRAAVLTWLRGSDG